MVAAWNLEAVQISESCVFALIVRWDEWRRGRQDSSSGVSRRWELALFGFHEWCSQAALNRPVAPESRSSSSRLSRPGCASSALLGISENSRLSLSTPSTVCVLRCSPVPTPHPHPNKARCKLGKVLWPRRPNPCFLRSSPPSSACQACNLCGLG